MAEEALLRGHYVTLISGPTNLIPPPVQKFIQIETSSELLNALKREIASDDCLIMSSAVSDFRPIRRYVKKLKREKGRLTLKFIPTKDILTELIRSRRPNLLVGFSLETENLIKNSYEKLRDKHMDLIVANRITRACNPFGDKKIDVYIIDKAKHIEHIKAQNKKFIAKVLLDKIEKLWYLKNNKQNDY